MGFFRLVIERESAANDNDPSLRAAADEESPMMNVSDWKMCQMLGDNEIGQFEKVK